MADNPLLSGITVPGPSSPGIDPWTFEGLTGLHSQGDQYEYDAYTDDYYAALPQLPEVVVSCTTPGNAFQGPFPEPIPDPAPAPGGGSGGGGSAPTTTAEPSPARSPYSVPKAGKLRTMRFILEALAKKLAPIFRSVIPRMPTPLTFLAESLLIGDDLADATLFDIKTFPQPTRTPLPAIINDPLREVIVWSPPAPKLAPLPSSYLSPLIFDFPMPGTTPIANPAPQTSPQPYAIPSPVTSPEVWPYAFPEVFVPTPVASPATPPKIGDFLPWADDPFSPALDTDSNPRGTISPDPAPAPLGALGFAPASNCPPCTKKTESKTKQKRSKCYVKLVREKSDPSKDRSTNWRKIKCQ